jgi:Pathogenicity locus
MDESERLRAEERRREAVCSPFMRIPRFPVDVARELLDSGYYRVDQLSGRSAESLIEEIRKKNKEKPSPHFLPALRMAIYFAETPTPDAKKLFLDQWI